MYVLRWARSEARAFYIPWEVARSLFILSSWGSSFPSVRPRKTFSFRGELSRITVIFSGAKRIIEVGRDLSRSSSPVPLLQHWWFHHLPRDWVEADESVVPQILLLALLTDDDIPEDQLKGGLQPWRVRFAFFHPSGTSSDWHALLKIMKNAFFTLKALCMGIL